MKMIPLSADSSAIERCLSREYLECRLMRDKAAVAAISASNPFPPLPAEFKGDRVVLQLNFAYNVPKQ
ncbi:MAG: hypothetical protein NTW28_24265, partial [Candidatus Solibacter sp.]|nr:hypothetical protein [Candidatus Solibacter sp.]